MQRAAVPCRRRGAALKREHNIRYDYLAKMAVSIRRCAYASPFFAGGQNRLRGRPPSLWS